VEGGVIGRVGGSSLLRSLGSAALAFSLTLCLACPSLGYLVLTHEAIIDAEWVDKSNVFWSNAFPTLPPNQLRDAHAYAYGGCVIQDMGLLPVLEPLLQPSRALTPRVAVINQEFARKTFGSVASALGGYYKMPDGTRIQVMGMAEDGKYESLTEGPQPAMFLPILQCPRVRHRWSCAPTAIRSN